MAAAGLFFLGGSQPQAMAQQVTPTADASHRTVSVTGSGSVQSTPDRAIVTIGVQTQADTASKALASNNQQMERLLSSLRSAGIANADIRTQFLQLYPQTEPQPTPLPNEQASPTATPPSYTAVNSVEVTVRDLDNLGTLLDQAVSAGGNLIQNVRFDVSNPNDSLDQARETAFAEASRKANQLATLAGMDLGPVVSINENSFFPTPAMDVAAGGREFAQSAVPISPGTQTYTVDIQVTFELQQP
jgi:uncharacterized protein YggE